ncbi:MAG: leucine-rich repeat domain-containing protein [Spirochaetales bacterium]|jgi:hypothetical protein|nr:leucine-rich repeat domain-containing protein [Spirochaetales bacterium]
MKTKQGISGIRGLLLLLGLALVVPGCSNPVGGNTVPPDQAAVINGITGFLNARGPNTPETPYTVTLPAINISDAWGAIADAVEQSGKYVILNLSGCSATGNSVEGSSSPSGNDMNIIYDNSYIKGIILPNSLTGIGDNAFYNCYNLTSVTIPPGVTSIGHYAFSSCYNLTGVSIPAGVTSIGNSAFTFCRQMSGITVAGANQYYSSPGGVLFTKDKSTLIQYPAGRSDTSYAIPNSVTAIGNSAFAGCYNLTEVFIPAGVTAIGDYAFAYTGLTSVSIPVGVTSIGNSAFAGCSNLTGVSIPAGVTSIGNMAFVACYQLSAITVDSANQNYSSAGGVLFNKDQSTLIQYPNGRSETSYAIPNSVTDIGSSAFYNCSNLTGITFPATLTTINSDAFAYCSNLADITFPDALTTINSYAFYQCEALTSVTFPAAVTNIGGWAFSYCRNLISVTFGGENTTIGSNAFPGGESGAGSDRLKNAYNAASPKAGEYRRDLWSKS